MNTFHTKFNRRFVDIILQELRQRGKRNQRLELYQEDAVTRRIVESILDNLCVAILVNRSITLIIFCVTLYDDQVHDL